MKNQDHRLSRIVVNAILKIDPDNIKVKEYIDKIPEEKEIDTLTQIKSNAQIIAILLTPGFILFYAFYKFIQNTQNKNKEYFDKLDKKKEEE